MRRPDEIQDRGFPQTGLIADQQMLQQALRAGGPKDGAASVAAAIEVLKRLDVDAYLKQSALDVDALPPAVENTWEWPVTR